MDRIYNLENIILKLEKGVLIKSNNFPYWWNGVWAIKCKDNIPGLINGEIMVDLACSLNYYATSGTEVSFVVKRDASKEEVLFFAWLITEPYFNFLNAHNNNNFKPNQKLTMNLLTERARSIDRGGTPWHKYRKRKPGRSRYFSWELPFIGQNNHELSPTFHRNKKLERNPAISYRVDEPL